MNFQFPEVEGPKPTNLPSYVETFWDPAIRQWTILVKDTNGFQIGEAEYAPNAHRAARRKRQIEATVPMYCNMVEVFS